jgi:hypothetical protein
MHGQSIQLSGQSHRKITDVDHFLHFAERFLRDLAGLERDEFPQIFFSLTEFVADAPDELSAPGRGYETPLHECIVCGADDAIRVISRRPCDGRKGAAVDRRARGDLFSIGRKEFPPRARPGDIRFDSQ